MWKDVMVSTTFTNGTDIRLDVVPAKYMIESIAMNVIIQSRLMVDIEDAGNIKSKTKIPYYDALIDDYCAGVHGAVLNNMLPENVKVLYYFVQDCVLNESANGLYLLKEKSKKGEPEWKLIILALDEYMDCMKQKYALLGKEIPDNLVKYNEYNEKFEKLMS